MRTRGQRAEARGQTAKARTRGSGFQPAERATDGSPGWSEALRAQPRVPMVNKNQAPEGRQHESRRVCRPSGAPVFSATDSQGFAREARALPWANISRPLRGLKPKPALRASVLWLLSSVLCP